MNDAIYNDTTLERLLASHFGLKTTLDKVIAREIGVGPSSTATVFLAEKKQLMAFIHSESKQTLGDVQKILTRMGLKAQLYVPPKGQPDYFDAIGREHFRHVFPGRSHISADDIIYYRTLASYNPALVIISEVKNGEIHEFNRDTRGGWRVAVKFSYRRIKTS